MFTCNITYILQALKYQSLSFTFVMNIPQKYFYDHQNLDNFFQQALKLRAFYFLV